MRIFGGHSGQSSDLRKVPLSLTEHGLYMCVQKRPDILKEQNQKGLGRKITAHDTDLEIVHVPKPVRIQRGVIHRLREEASKVCPLSNGGRLALDGVAVDRPHRAYRRPLKDPTDFK